MPTWFDPAVTKPANNQVVWVVIKDGSTDQVQGTWLDNVGVFTGPNIVGGIRFGAIAPFRYLPWWFIQRWRV